MYFLKSWLEEYIDINNYSNNQLADLITAKSMEIEEIIEVNNWFNNLVVLGQIQNVQKHPNADNLKVFQVDLGNFGQKQIVSAAPNVKEGLMVPVAMIGAKLPHVTIAKQKLRDIVSEGMCCGKEELLLEEKSYGLWEVDEKHKNKLGYSIESIFPELFPTDTLFDIKVLPDKIASQGNHLGLAIEIARVVNDLSMLKPKAKRWVNTDSKELLRLVSDLLLKFKENDNKIILELKQGYNDQEIKAFSVIRLYSESSTNFKPSLEIIKRLFLLQKPCTFGPADISNYILYDVGQPNHFFDTKSILQENNNGNIVLEFKETEKETEFTGLGQLKKTILPEKISILKDVETNAILALPGISGSDSHKVTDKSKDILVEIANFSGIYVAKTAFNIKYRSDSARLWSGNINPKLIIVGLVHLLESLMNKEIYLEIVRLPLFNLNTIQSELETDKNLILAKYFVSLVNNFPANKIEFSLENWLTRIDSRGQDYWKEKAVSKLNLLGKWDEKTEILIPNDFYTDLHEPKDVFLEITRLIGYDDIQKEPITARLDQEISKLWDYKQVLRKVTANLGYTEVINRPFLSKKHENNPDLAIKLLNAYRSYEPYFRTQLYPSLLLNLANNQKQGNTGGVFEINQVYENTNRLIKKEEFCLVTTSKDPYNLTSFIYNLSDFIIDSKVKYKTKTTKNIGQIYNYNIISRDFELDIKLVEFSKNKLKKYDIDINSKVWAIIFEIPENFAIHNFKQKYTDESIYPNLTRDYSIISSNKLSFEILQTVVKNLEQLYKETELSIKIKPIERINETLETQIINFSLKFTSYNSTLSKEFVLEFEQKMLLTLQDIESKTKFR